MQWQMTHNRHLLRSGSLLGCAVWLALASSAAAKAPAPVVPQLVGEWWTVAGDPDLGELTSEKQEPVDFGIWQADDGTWQIWSCIRKTKEPGHTRLFFCWEGKNLTDKDWKPMGIAMHADPKYGEKTGGLQAPYVIQHDGKYVMFYGDWANICSAESTDGKKFTRRLNDEGKAGMFQHPAEAKEKAHSRDPMVLKVGDLWHCYYTAYPDRKGAVFCHTSPDLVNWSGPHLVAAGGEAGDGPYSAECPFVVEPRPGHYFLFRTQKYSKTPETRVYYSTDPLDFGIDEDDEHFVCKMPVAAPEIFEHDGQYYMAALLPSVKGIRISRLDWVPADEAPAQ